MKKAPVSIPEVSSLVSLQPRTAGWSALIASPGRAKTVAKELLEELELDGVKATLIEAPDAAQLVVSLARQHENVVVIHGLDDYQDTDWRILDVDRTKLERQRATILVLDTEALDGLVRKASHLASWLRHTWELDEQAGKLTEEEREGRLQALRAWTNKSDDEVLALAMRGELPGEPEFAEWLVLLGKGSLLGSA
jgi:hypothetical protein